MTAPVAHEVTGILCGLASEAALARRMPGKILIACAGSRPQQARWAARQLVTDGATRLLSFGIAGALEPGLPIGSLIIGSQVMSVDGAYACDKTWSDSLIEKLPAAHSGPVWGAETIIPSAKAKRALYEKSRCLIADMESHCVAQIAAESCESGLPFAILRAVSDEADTEIPAIVHNVITTEGGVDYGQLLRNMLRHPIRAGRQLPDMLRLGRGTGKALGALKEAASALH